MHESGSGLVMAPPAVAGGGKEHPAPALAHLARAWRDEVGAEVGDVPLLAMVMANDPASVALFFALAALRPPILLLSPHPAGWSSSPPVPPGTPLVLPPATGRAGATLAGEGERQGFRVRTLAAGRALTEPPSGAGAADAALTLASSGVVLFTSGSTDRPKPVYRPMSRVLAGARSLVEAFDLAPGCSVLGTLPLYRGYGFVQTLALAAAVGGRLVLLERFEPGLVLRALASGTFEYWPAMPIMVDLLGRYPARAIPPAPRVCVVTGRLTSAVSRRFASRFGIPIRQMYGTTEAGPVSADAAAPDEVRPETAGRPLPGVRLAIGDDPVRPVPAGAPGRVWVSSPAQMLGYGFPPAVEAAAGRAGWLATEDMGRVDGGGTLTLDGRLDDCIRTAGGYLVNPGQIAAAVEAHGGVSDCAVVPLAQRQGAVIGLLLQGPPDLDVAAMRRHLAQHLPPWCQPRLVAVTPELPRLSGGKTDRLACIRLLQGAGPGPVGVPTQVLP